MSAEIYRDLIIYNLMILMGGKNPNAFEELGLSNHWDRKTLKSHTKWICTMSTTPGMC